MEMKMPLNNWYKSTNILFSTQSIWYIGDPTEAEDIAQEVFIKVGNMPRILEEKPNFQHGSIES
jgi:DNA-directed RNA polymerase specialized sigma24 family protein